MVSAPRQRSKICRACWRLAMIPACLISMVGPSKVVITSQPRATPVIFWTFLQISKRWFVSSSDRGAIPASPAALVDPATISFISSASVSSIAHPSPSREKIFCILLSLLVSRYLAPAYGSESRAYSSERGRARHWFRPERECLFLFRHQNSAVFGEH